MAALVVAPALLRAQQRDEPTVCLGFTFGQWIPALDWKAAGHATQIDPATHQRADDGRDWATTQAVQDEHTIVLLPSWWPDGVNVTLPNRAPAALLHSALKLSKLPKAELIPLPIFPVGAPPAFGAIHVQNFEWFQWPPPLLRTAVRMPSGTVLMSRQSSSTLLPASSGCFSSAVFRFVT